MRKIGCVAILLIMLGGMLSAQESNENPPDQGVDHYIIQDSLAYERGDQTFNFTVGAAFPLFFTGVKGILDKKVNVGGFASLSYNYFLSPHWFVGGEVGGSFSGTLGKNVLFIVPILLHGGYQFTISRFEFPLSFSLGIAPQQHLENDLIGFFMKVRVAGFFRLNHDWSFGLDVGWWLVPEATKESDKNATGSFLDLSLMVRYHF